MNYFRVFGLFIATLWLAACVQPKFESICEDNGSVRDCTPKEQAMIDDMHYIIKAIHNYEMTHPEQINWAVRGNSMNPRVIYLGENHTEIVGQIQTLATVNTVADAKTIYLREGADRFLPYEKNCGLDVIFQEFLVWQWEKLGIAYDPVKAYNWRVSQGYEELFQKTKRSYDLSGLGIADMTCGYWDDRKALDECFKDLNLIPKRLKVRNLGMNEAVEKALSNFNRVVVSAGYSHLPIGEVVKLKNNNPSRSDITSSMEDFYGLVKDEKRKPEATRSLKISAGVGSTKVIYDFLKDRDIPFVERIHGKMWVNATAERSRLVRWTLGVHNNAN
jgi:hypothetical protein